jgi:hypothetical protein
MYDVFKIIKSENVTHFYCLCDENETKLHNAFSVYFNNSINPNSKNFPPVSNLVKIFITFIIKTEEYSHTKYNEVETSIVLWDSKANTQFVVDIPTPPPKLSA